MKLIDLDHLALQAEEVMQGGAEEVIKELLALNRASAGARPKALIGVNANRKSVSLVLNSINSSI